MIEESKKIALEMALEAAREGDVISFLKHIYDSKFLEGASRTLGATRGLDGEAIHEILSDSVDRLYQVASEGKKILFPGGYLFKIIERKTTDYYRIHRKYEEFDERRGNHSPGEVSGAAGTYAPSSKEQEDRKMEGIRIARILLPKIGRENVQKVMGYIIDAVERGEEDVTNQEIADALGLSDVSVRKWKQRGFERLKRAAIEDGYRKEFLRDLTYSDADEEQESGEE